MPSPILRTYLRVRSAPHLPPDSCGSATARGVVTPGRATRGSPKPWGGLFGVQSKADSLAVEAELRALSQLGVKRRAMTIATHERILHRIWVHLKVEKHINSDDPAETLDQVPYTRVIYHILSLCSPVS